MSIEATSAQPVVIQEGVFGASFKYDGEDLHLRMEIITQENAKYWTNFKEHSIWMANETNLLNPNNGVLSYLVSLAGKCSYPSYERAKDVTGFTPEEFMAFTKQANERKTETSGKITKVLKKNSIGINHMNTAFYRKDTKYVVYITRNRNFSIIQADESIEKNWKTLKNVINAYQDILISIGSDFSEDYYFHNRGISRNPYWVFEGKYAGLSMLLHGFTAIVAQNFFPKKEVMHVSPIGSMQVIIQQYLHRGEGWIERLGKRIDLLDVRSSPDDGEGGLNVIKVSALVRIYNEKIAILTDSSKAA